jgi:ferredoxin
MDDKFQQHISFYLTGRKGPGLESMDARYRPALFARYKDLTALRYDFPLVLNDQSPPDRAVLSLSRLVDDAITALADDPNRDRIARHGYRVERELRRQLAVDGQGDLAALWGTAVARLTAEDESVDDSARRLWKQMNAAGEMADVDGTLPALVVSHAWGAVQESKSIAFREKAERLLLKLHDILEAEFISSPTGRTAERLKAGVGASFAGTFDFDRLSKILVESKPGIELSDSRRKRIHHLIEVLETQAFYPMGGAQPYAFAFDRCSDALDAFQARHAEAGELIKALEIAELEVNGDYRESVHDAIFDGFGSNGLAASQLAKLPDYLVCLNAGSMSPVDTTELAELLAAGLPFKMLVQNDDVLELSALAESKVALGLKGRQMVSTAIGSTDVFVLQASASHVYRKCDSLLRGLIFNGPALFSIFSGSNSHTGNIPGFMVAAAATESRAFPTLVYDPSAGSDWATRLKIDDNPKCEDDWPVSTFTYEGEKLTAVSEEMAFTLADFMAMDERFLGRFAVVPRDHWNEAMISVPQALEIKAKDLPSQVPYITFVDDDGCLQKAIVDDNTLLETRRCRSMWHSLQELGGIHNSHAERLLAAAAAAAPSAPATAAFAPSPAPAPALDSSPATAAAPPPPAPAAAAATVSDDPFIETPRCTSCNECTQINAKMFAYDDNKQAYIADPDAGTFRELVEAAEGCQVSIIHPGKPRNPKEPGLDDLIKRAAEFI